MPDLARTAAKHPRCSVVGLCSSSAADFTMVGPEKKSKSPGGKGGGSGDAHNTALHTVQDADIPCHPQGHALE